MSIAIRPATLADAELLSTLGARLFQETFGPDNTPENMTSYLADAFRPDVQTAELADTNKAALIVESDGAAVGYALLNRDSAEASITATRPTEIQRIYVDKSLHGTGAAARLMDVCVQQARAWNADILWLAVWERNPRAIAFYEKHGFRRVGRKTFQLGADLQHDFVMARNLSS